MKTKRFTLRQMQEGDASQLYAGWTLDAVAAEMLNAEEREWSVQSQRNFFRTHASGKEKLILGVTARETGQTIGIYIINMKPRDLVFTTSIVIGVKSWRGKRVAGEIGQTVYRHFFDDLGYAKAKVNVRPQNKPMLWLLLQQGGWKKEAVLKEHIFDRRTQTRGDLLVFGMLAEEWRTSRLAAEAHFTPWR